MLNINFNNINNVFLKKKVKKLFLDALKQKSREFEFDFCILNCEVDLKFVSEEEIKTINKQYRSVDKKTDVLSFPMIDFSDKKKVLKEVSEIVEDEILLGDILICKTVAKAQAKEFCHSLSREICFLALHGFLHLLGYDHIEKNDEIIMQTLAKKILEGNKIRR